MYILWLKSLIELVPPCTIRDQFLLRCTQRQEEPFLANCREPSLSEESYESNSLLFDFDFDLLGSYGTNALPFFFSYSLRSFLLVIKQSSGSW